MNIESPQQFNMFPEDTPPNVARYWAAKDRWYSSGTTDPPTREEFVLKFKPVISTRTLDRIRHDHRDLVGPWPPKRTDQPPWRKNGTVDLTPADRADFLNVHEGEIHVLHQVRTACIDERGNPVVRVDEYDPTDGHVVHSFISHLHQLPAVAAVFAGVLDIMSDNRLDGIVRTCLLIAQHLTGRS